MKRSHILSAACDLAALVSNLPEIRVVRDRNDDFILATAIKAGAGFLVARDRDLLSLGHYEGIQIVTPESFAEILKSDAVSERWPDLQE
ncbi:MAG: putative toxin-antitoxin system toxin component, PIN family [Blastocatellia bacterium]